MDERRLVELEKFRTPVDLSTVLRGPASDVGVRVANLKDELEVRLMEEPDDYLALVLLGELNLRTGLKRSARTLLYRASLLKPPSWEMYQRTALLLRRAEADQSREVERLAGVPPPLWLRRMAAALTRQVAVLRSNRSAVVGEVCK